MKKEEKLKLMNDLFANQEEITTKELKECGFHSSEIPKLIDEGILEKVDRGIYKEANNIEKILIKGREYYSENDLPKAKECFEKCVEADPTDFEYNLLLFDVLVSLQQYQEAFDLLGTYAFTQENEAVLQEVRMYLYLLTPYIQFSNEDLQELSEIPLEILLLNKDDCEFEDVFTLNKIINAVYYNRYLDAKNLINILSNKESNFKFEYKLIKKLIYPIARKQSEHYRQLTDLVVAKDYESVIKVLNEKSKSAILSQKEKNILTIANDIVKMNNGEEVAFSYNDEEENFNNAIYTKNYRRALLISENYNNLKNISSNSNVIYMLLEDINNLMDVLEQEKFVPATFTDVVQCLLNKDVDNAFERLHSYLETIDKTQYEFLVANLIKLSVLEKDYVFTKPMIALTYISKDSFQFDINTYIQGFYESLGKNEHQKAKTYLDIISNAKNIGVNFDATDLLVQVLEATIGNEDVSIDDFKFSNKQEEIIKEPIIKQPEVLKEHKIVLDIPKEEVTNPNRYLPKSKNPDVDFINEKSEILQKKGGMLLLRVMSDERINDLQKIIRETPNLVGFTIGRPNERRIVLRYNSIKEKIDNIPEIIKKGNQEYRDKNYKASIREFKKLLSFGRPSSFIYSRIGICHMKLNHYKDAIDYLTVGNELAKQEDSKYDYTELLEYIRGYVPESERKAHVNMELEEFYGDTNEYGIDNLYGIVDHITTKGPNIDKYCSDLGLDKDQTNVVKIMCARRFYTREMDNFGDMVLEEVERSKEKTPLVKSLYFETTRTKRFYKNRKDNN